MNKPRDKAIPLSIAQAKSERKQFVKKLISAIKTARSNKGYMQQDLADLARLDLSYVNKIENGKYIPTSYVLWRIAKAMDMTLSDLTKGL